MHVVNELYRHVGHVGLNVIVITQCIRDCSVNHSLSTYIRVCLVCRDALQPCECWSDDDDDDVLCVVESGQ